MMNNLDFSLAPLLENIHARIDHYLSEFKDQRQTEVSLQFMEWSEMWSSLRAIALQREGPVISEVGSTWIGSFVGMTALRQFVPAEVAHIVPADDVIPAAWETASFRGDNRIWSIPWHVDSRVVLYWRDMLEDAGIDEATAFATPEQMEETFERLVASGVETPWLEGTDATNDTVYHAASWVWSKGGDYISENGRYTLFHTPEVLDGLSHYFGLYRFMPKFDGLLHPYRAAGLFAQRQSAALISGTWTFSSIQNAQPELIDRLGAALPPGPPFVGGTNLVIWRHIPPRLETDALELLRLLMSYEVQLDITQRVTGALLPSRLSVLEKTDDFALPQYRVFADAIKVGRSMPSISIWSIVEERLASALKRIWMKIIEDPNQSIADIIASQLEPLARRLDRSLAQVQR